MFKASFQASARPLGSLVKSTPTATLNGAWTRSFGSRSGPSTSSHLWQAWAQNSFQSSPRMSRPATPFTSAFRRVPGRGFRSSAWRRAGAGNGSGKGGEQVQPQTLRERLRKLMKEYGWVAVGVYFGLSVVDLPLSFLIVRWAGVETIGNIEHYIVSTVGSVIPESIRQGAKDLWRKTWQAFKRTEQKELGSGEISEKVEMASWGVEEAQERNKQDASLTTQLALAYAIHKSFIFVRVPLTAALTPKVVKVLRSWGWNIGKRRRPSS
ncbi:putative N-terminal acetyltransferase [Paramyrothecium foliicola]|nr:putative N-terminal acetyltransferase [Paramyrothecium foliicola]